MQYIKQMKAFNAILRQTLNGEPGIWFMLISIAHFNGCNRQLKPELMKVG